MKRLVFALMGFVLGLAALFLAAPEQFTSQANAQQYPQGAQNLGTCPGNATAYRGTNGTYSCSCPSGAARSGSVWGTGTYTDDSSICRAAVHAGVIGGIGGQVTFSVIGGYTSYQGSTSYGVSSSSYGSYQGSYQFSNAVAARPVLPRFTPGLRQSGPNGFGNAVVPACPADAKAYRGSGQTVTCACNNTGMRSGSVWGTGTYTDDSNICRAALHAGMIGNSGGQVTFSVTGGLPSYRGSSQYGVTSLNFGGWQGSYSFGMVAGQNPTPPGFTRGPGPGRFGNAGVPACPANASSYRGTGQTVTCDCSSGGTRGGSVWGTGTYTDDSNICQAAVHAGAIGSNGGRVTFSVTGGLASYQGSNRYGVSSSNYGGWQGSFQFNNAVATSPVPPRTTQGPRWGNIRSSNYPACPATAQASRGQYGAGFTCSCSASDVASGNVWGWITYTDDSRICRAALQAGLVGRNGGNVAVTIMAGLSSYQGNTYNGVSSSNYGSFAGSFQLGRAPN